MTKINLVLDKKAALSINELKKHYGVDSNAKIIRKALALLQVAAIVENENGKMFAEKINSDRTKKIVEIIVS